MLRRTILPLAAAAAAAEAQVAQSIRSFVPDGGRGRGQVPGRGFSGGAARRVRALRRDRRADPPGRAEILERGPAGGLFVPRGGPAAPFPGSVQAGRLVARMERSGMREQSPRIALRSMRATAGAWTCRRPIR